MKASTPGRSKRQPARAGARLSGVPRSSSRPATPTSAATRKIERQPKFSAIRPPTSEHSPAPPQVPIDHMLTARWRPAPSQPAHHHHEDAREQRSQRHRGVHRRHRQPEVRAQHRRDVQHRLREQPERHHPQHQRQQQAVVADQRGAGALHVTLPHETHRCSPSGQSDVQGSSAVHPGVANLSRASACARPSSSGCRMSRSSPPWRRPKASIMCAITSARGRPV